MKPLASPACRRPRPSSSPPSRNCSPAPSWSRYERGDHPMRAGRKRNATADRYPCGKPRPRKQPPPPDQPHRKGYGSNPLAETQHGRYYLDGAINAPQHLAGVYFGRSRLRYRSATGAPDSLRSRSEGYLAKDEPEADARYIAEYENVRGVLGRLVVDVEWVIVLDAMLADLTDYRKGLDILRRHYGV